MTCLNWITFSFSTCFLAIVVLNFFKENKFKWLEIALDFCLTVLLIVCLIALPIFGMELQSTTVYLETMWASYMAMLFMAVLFIVSRTLLFFVYKKDKMEALEKTPNVNKKKSKKLLKIVMTSLTAVLIVVCVGLPFVLIPTTREVELTCIYGSLGSTEITCDYELINNSKYKITYISIDFCTYEGEVLKHKEFQNLLPNEKEEFSIIIERNDSNNEINYAPIAKIETCIFDAPSFEYISYAMIPMIVISGYFTIYVWLKKKDNLQIEENNVNKRIVCGQD